MTQPTRQPVGQVHHRCGRARGFTLAEVLLASVILALLVAAVSHGLVVGQTHTLDAMSDMRAVAIAEATLEQVLAEPYTDPDGDTSAGPDGGESTLATFDAMDDYHGFSEAAGALTDPAGNAYPSAYQTFSRSITAAYGSVNVPALGGSHNGLTVTITVSDAGGREWVVTRFIREPA